MSESANKTDEKIIIIGLAYNASSYAKYRMNVPSDISPEDLRATVESTARRVLCRDGNEDVSFSELKTTQSCSRVTGVSLESGDDLMDAFPLEDNTDEIGFDACLLANKLVEGSITRDDFINGILTSMRALGRNIPEFILPIEHRVSVNTGSADMETTEDQMVHGM